MATEKAKKQVKEKTKTTTSKTHRSKKEIAFYSFIGVLAVVSLLFAYNIIDYFYIEPTMLAGKPLYGDRLEDLVPIDDAIIKDAESYGSSQPGVNSVKVTIEGMIVYIDVRVDSTTGVETAKSSAENISNYLISAIDNTNADSSKEYNFQLVVSNEDPTLLSETNRAEELEYIKSHDISIVEQVVAYAEEYPTATNIERANKNIAYMQQTYPDEAAAFQQRVDNLTELTAEQEEALGDIPALEVDKEIKPSTIADYPSWGTLNAETAQYDWK